MGAAFAARARHRRPVDRRRVGAARRPQHQRRLEAGVLDVQTGLRQNAAQPRRVAPRRLLIMNTLRLIVWMVSVLSAMAPCRAQAAGVVGEVRDETGGALPGVTIELRAAGGASVSAVSDNQGRYRIARIVPGRYQI